MHQRLAPSYRCCVAMGRRLNPEARDASAPMAGSCFAHMWAGRIGLEWLFRLLSQPRHLWRRYLVEPWFVLRLFLSEFTRRRRPGHSG